MDANEVEQAPVQSALPIYQRSDGQFQVEQPQQFKKGDRIMTPEGEGVVLYFNEHFGEYSVSLAERSDYFKPEDLRLL